jgi:hypothetical protein
LRTWPAWRACSWRWASSALHGLGHWANYYPEPVAAIIEAYLLNHAPLRQYALAARSGAVL